MTDQIMPQMTGVQLAEELMNIRPEVPIILCTGFSEGIGPTEAKSMGIKKFIIKPVIKQEIALTIHNMLEGDKRMTRILVIDDDDEMRKMLRRMLEREGYVVVAASKLLGVGTFSKSTR